MVSISAEQYEASGYDSLDRVIAKVGTAADGSRAQGSSYRILNGENPGHCIAKKIAEEGYESAAALEFQSDEELKGELSQLLYWMVMACAARGIPFSDVLRGA